MAFTPGSRIGVFQLIDLIGRGGMGEVYRARDTKLDRDVAIKVLPESFAKDSERLARFTREAKTLASLNHPNIGAIYGLEESGGVTALVMELVEGDDLSQRIARGAIPVDEALPIAKQIADALEAAHEQGIIHRDLKPANIKVRSDGTVKVLDFGLAKAMESTSAMSPSMSQLPTITTPAMTQAGVILGTAAYMSPEQARGKTVDRRADIWAYGCVLFEMLTGQRAFPGEDLTDTLAAVVKVEPMWEALPSDVPPPVRTLLQGCLVKDPRRRIADISTALFVLDRVASLGAPAAGDAASPRVDPAVVEQQVQQRVQEQTDRAVAAVRRVLGRRLVLVGTSTLIVGVLAGMAAWSVMRVEPPAPPETRVEIGTPATDLPTHFALSPDGRQIAFVASGDGTSRLWLRSLASTTAQPLPGTESAAFPFWSPDSRSVGFFTEGGLKRLDIGSGAPQALATAVAARGGTWNADGVILFAPTAAGPLLRVAASGGEAVPVTTLGRQGSHQFPVFLPDGRHFLFFATGTPNTSGIYLGMLDSDVTTRLTPADTRGVYLQTSRALRASSDLGPAEASTEGGWLAWVRDGTLVAQRLDLAQPALTGDPVTLADSVAVDAGVGAVSAAAKGLLAYRASGATRRQLAWFDRSGKTLGAWGAPDENNLHAPTLSPDDQRVAVFRTVQGNTDIWLLDGARMSRFTFDAASDRFPVWSPDGSRIVFYSTQKGPGDLYQKSASGAGTEERLAESPQTKVATDWSADGRLLLYYSIDPQAARDLWVFPTDGERTPGVFLKTGFDESHGQFSPDGRWVAYMSNESGRDEIYIRPFVAAAAPGAGASPAAGQWQVSTAGGVFPRWRSDGRELYYVGPTGELMAAPIAATATAIESGAPVVLFPTRIFRGGVDNGQGPQYDVARDGRFLINTVPDDEAAVPITLIQNWRPDETP